MTGEELEDTPGTTGRRWVIDPIDGTSAFALRIPMFNVLLAVEDTEGSAVGVISYPMSQDLIYAGRGLGCWHQVNDGTIHDHETPLWRGASTHSEAPPPRVT